MTPSSSARIESEIVEYFSTILRVPRSQIRTDIHILELGVDSIMLIEAQRWLKVRFGCVVEVQQFFEELNTLDRIVAFAATMRPQDVAGLAATAAASPPEASPQRVVAARPVPSTPVLPGAKNAYGLMRSQLALLGEVIEAQNRLLIQTRAGTRPDDRSI